jgi:hypothetical protein
MFRYGFLVFQYQKGVFQSGFYRAIIFWQIGNGGKSIIYVFRQKNNRNTSDQMARLHLGRFRRPTWSSKCSASCCPHSGFLWYWGIGRWHGFIITGGIVKILALSYLLHWLPLMFGHTNAQRVRRYTRSFCRCWWAGVNDDSWSNHPCWHIWWGGSVWCFKLDSYIELHFSLRHYNSFFVVVRELAFSSWSK